MTYWLDLFTGTTWEEFQRTGAKISGFRENNWKRAEKIKPGDIFLCYLVGVSRWVGLLEVESPRFRDNSRIWTEEEFPVRFKVKPIAMLSPKHGVPMSSLEGQLSFFQLVDNARKWSGYVRNSPTKYRDEDGIAIAAAVRSAEASPVSRPVDDKKLKRSANLYKGSTKLYKASLHQGSEQVDRVVGVPTDVDDSDSVAVLTQEVDEKTPTHTEIQWRLLDLGSQIGLKVWAPRNDRNREWNGRSIAKIERLLPSLPTNFDAVTNDIVEQIDVIWMSEQNAIVAAFEVEHSTAIYSGLLRMSDLLTMQPNIDIKLYIVEPDDRYAKFERNIPRPTFAFRKKPLHTMCGFLPYSQLCDRLDSLKEVVRHLKPEFLDDISIYFDPSEELGN
jgi:hypothetical protein